MSTSPLMPWHISEAQFPQQGTPSEQLKFLLQYAVLAPSGHNTQPWLFKIENESVELYADRTRSLPVVDPQDRALIISCGAALFNLRVAMWHFGYTDITKVFPDQGNPDFLARVQFGDRYYATAEDNALFDAISKRHTHRQAFSAQPLPHDLLEKLQVAAIAEQAWLELIQTQETRSAIANLVAEGDRRQMADPHFRRELATWIHSNRSQCPDGMPGYAHGFGDWMSYAGAWVIQHFDLGNTQAKKDEQLAVQPPLLAVLGTKFDTPEDWLAAGQALTRVLLCARADGVWSAFMNQPIEVTELRPQLGQLLEQSGYPQLLLRFGFGADVKPTPRRSVDEVLVSTKGSFCTHILHLCQSLPSNQFGAKN
jgi:nitroreductase